MRMGTPSKKSGGSCSLRSKLFQSLSSAKSGLQVVYTSRTRGNSDNLLSNSSTLISALSGSLRKGREEGDNENEFEEYKSEDEMRRALSETSEEESCQSDAEGRPRPKRRGKKVMRKEQDIAAVGKGAANAQAASALQLNSESGASEISEAYSLEGADLEENDEPPFLEPNAMCKDHKLKVHSWHKLTRKMLCTYCIQMQNLPNEQI